MFYITKKNRLLKLRKHRPSIELKNRIKNLNFEIKTHFFIENRNKIRRKLLPGNSKSLWNAVKAAKDIGADSLPGSMTLGGRKVIEHDRSGCFASL